MGRYCAAVLACSVFWRLRTRPTIKDCGHGCPASTWDKMSSNPMVRSSGIARRSWRLHPSGPVAARRFLPFRQCFHWSSVMGAYSILGPGGTWSWMKLTMGFHLSSGVHKVYPPDMPIHLEKPWKGQSWFLGVILHLVASWEGHLPITYQVPHGSTESVHCWCRLDDHHGMKLGHLILRLVHLGILVELRLFWIRPKVQLAVCSACEGLGKLPVDLGNVFVWPVLGGGEWAPSRVPGLLVPSPNGSTGWFVGRVDPKSKWLELLEWTLSWSSTNPVAKPGACMMALHSLVRCTCWLSAVLVCVVRLKDSHLRSCLTHLACCREMPWNWGTKSPCRLALMGLLYTGTSLVSLVADLPCWHGCITIPFLVSAWLARCSNSWASCGHWSVGDCPVRWKSETGRHPSLSHSMDFGFRHKGIFSDGPKGLKTAPKAERSL